MGAESTALWAEALVQLQCSDGLSAEYSAGGA